MPDRDKVIKEFADYVKYFKPHCIGDVEDHEMLKDVLELLKEQEPVKPKYIPPKSIYSWECGVCAEPFDRIANYCPNCGKPVKWE